MTFEWALDEMRKGKKVQRQAWFTKWSGRSQQCCWIEVYLGHPILRFLFSGNLTGEDLLAKDWIEHIPYEMPTQEDS